MEENTENTERLIKLYFELGLSDSEILSFLALNHHVIISISTLKRKLRSMRLSRKTDFSDLLDVALFITQELKWSGQLHGYRWMHQKCILSGLKIPRDTVYHIMKLLDLSRHYIAEISLNATLNHNKPKTKNLVPFWYRPWQNVYELSEQTSYNFFCVLAR